MEEGYRPTAEVAAHAAEVIFCKSPSSAATFVLAALCVVKDPACLVDVVEGVLASARSTDDPRFARAALDLSRDKALPARSRMTLALGALNHVSGLSPEDPLLDELIDHCEDLVLTSADESISQLWLDGLEDLDGWANRVLGVDERKVAIALVRLRRESHAIGRLVNLVHHLAAGDGRQDDAGSIVEFLRELGAEPDVVERCERLARGPTALDEVGSQNLDPDAPIRLVFVAGDETERRHDTAIESWAVSKFGNRVSIKLHHPGWSPNWSEAADRALNDLRSANALIVSPFIRTNLGRRLRERAGEMGKPWVPCTGRGRSSLKRSIEDAVRVVGDPSAYAKSN